MSLPVTYQNVIDTVASWLENNCINSYTKWGSCPAQCKVGYRTNWVYFAGSNAATKGSRFRYRLQNGIGSGLSQNYIKTQLNNFVDSLGANRNINIPEEEFIDFMLDLGKFCAARVYMFGAFNADDPNDIHNGTARVSRTKNTATYLVYRSSGTINNPFTLSGTEQYKILAAADVNNVINTVINSLSTISRCISAQYTIEFSST